MVNCKKFSSKPRNGSGWVFLVRIGNVVGSDWVFLGRIGILFGSDWFISSSDRFGSVLLKSKIN